MKKSEYEKYIKPEEFAALFDEWDAKGKPLNNDPLYLKIWDGVVNAVKACIGALQNRYHCQYQDYEDKVMEATCLMIKKLQVMEGTPKNIVTMSYLPVLGVCCGKKALQQEFENNCLSIDNELNENGDTFIDSVNFVNY